MKAGAFALAFAAALSGVVAGTRADAGDDGPLTVVVTNHLDAEIVPLLRAELHALGMRVAVVDKGNEEVIPRDLSVAARRFDAVAAIRLLVSEGKVEVWIADRVTGKVVLREVLLQPLASKTSESEVALRAVELLRASLMEVGAPHPSRGEVAAPAALAAILPAAPVAGRSGIEVGAAVAASPGGLSPAFGVWIELHHRISRFLSAAVVTELPVQPSQVTRTEGRADVSTRALGAEIQLRPDRPADRRWQAAAGVGAGVLWSTLQGFARDPLVSERRSVATAAGLLAGSLGYRLSSNVGLSATVTGFLAFRPVGVLFLDQEVATFGRFVAIGSLAMEVAWP